MCLLETACPACKRAGKRSPFMSEQLTFDQMLRQGRAIDRHKGRAGSRAELVDGSRGQFLAGSAFAADQHGSGARGHSLDQREHLLHRARLPHHVEQGASIARLALQHGGFSGQAFVTDRALEQRLKNLRLDGLLQEPERPQIVHDGNRMADIAETGQNDGWCQVAALQQSSQKLSAVENRHEQVRDNGIERYRAKFLQRFLAMLRGFRNIPFRGNHGSNRVALLGVIVHNQDSNRF